MRTLSLDIETYSGTDLIKHGVYRYVEDPEFTLLLIAYAVDDEPVSLIDITTGPSPTLDELKALLCDAQIIKIAYNANFERVCLSAFFNLKLPLEQWRCTAVQAASLSLPRTLAAVTNVMGLPEDKRKLDIGKSLIQYFCKPSRSNGGKRNTSDRDPAKWETFKEYCKQDVEVERTVRTRLERFPLLAEEWKLWILDQRINDKGVKIDRILVSEAIQCSEAHRAKLEAEAIALTNLENPNSLPKLKAWLSSATDSIVTDLTKAAIPELIKSTDNYKVKRILKIRQELGKTSVSKYQAIERVVNADSRARGLYRFYGASRTGRWAGQLIQTQNLAQNKLADLALARQLLRESRHDDLEMLYGNVQDTLSQLIRTAFIPDKDKVLYVLDFSAIEARVLSWLADERWRMDVFREHGQIYEASASRMFHVPIERIRKGLPEYELRQKGKIAELALGYGGAVGALIAMGALRMGLSEDELPKLVSAWRASNPAIKAFWWGVENKVRNTIQDNRTTEIQGLRFSYESGFLFIRLPSGRRLAYAKPRIEGDEITYEGVEQGKKVWGRIKTYGAKLVENIVQAISRDCLAVSMTALAEKDYAIVSHVHDEVVIEAEQSQDALENMKEIMSITPTWAAGLPLRVEGFVCDFYQKG